jgi:hypothetical protein
LRGGGLRYNVHWRFWIVTHELARFADANVRQDTE